MNYIINPAVFYWMSVVDAVCFWSIGVALLSGIALVIMTCIRAFEYLDDDDLKVVAKAIKISLTVFIVSALITIFTPSKNTMIQILVAKCATYDNASLTVESLKSAVDYIVEAIKSLK